MGQVFKVIGVISVVFVLGTCSLVLVGVGTVSNDPDFQDAVGGVQESSEGLTGPRGNAVRSAKQYLRTSAVSRSVLIKQLSSEYGSGYSLADATAAVDSLNVDWNEQAARSAKQYIKMSGFSRSGLIKQLSYGVGEEYNVADATAAVDSLGVDWNEQAARSAKQYLSISGFSCKGLIDQLSSEYLEENRAYYSGDGYTESQATYGARKAGAC